MLWFNTQTKFALVKKDSFIIFCLHRLLPTLWRHKLFAFAMLRLDKFAILFDLETGGEFNWGVHVKSVLLFSTINPIYRSTHRLALAWIELDFVL